MLHTGNIRSIFLFVLAVALLWTAGAFPAAAQERVYKIGMTYPFPPWDVGPLEGFDADLLSAICEANGPMQCRFVPLGSEACIDTNANGDMTMGTAMASGEIDGCIPWYPTDARKQLGAEFSDSYSEGPQPQLIAAVGDTRYDNLEPTGSLNGAKVGFLTGFFTDPHCLAGRYSDFTASFYSSGTAGRDQMVAALGDGLDLIFWDNAANLPDGTKVVGQPILDCGPGLSLMVFPPSRSRPHQSDDLRRDFNCGLALIRQSGKLAQICAASNYPGGSPTCVLDGPPPTVQCVAENPPG